MNRLIAIGALLLFSCNEEIAPLDPSVTVEFPDAVGGTVPYRSGGRLRVRVTASDLSHLGPGRAEIRVVSVGGGSPLEFVDAGLAQTRFDLLPVPEIGGIDGGSASRVEGIAVVAVPTGGEVTVTAKALGASATASVSVEVPAVSVERVRTQRVAGGLLESEVCIGTNADGMSIAYALVGAQNSAGGASGVLPIEPGACPAAASSAQFHATLIARSAGDSFQVQAKLDGTSVGVVSTVRPVVDPSPYQVLIMFPQGSLGQIGRLAPEGAVVFFNVLVQTTSGVSPPVAAPGVPVTMATAPAATLLASTIVTDATGLATGYFIAPTASSMVLEATVGGAWNAAILDRP